MQIVAPRPTLGGLMTPLELPDLEAWYDLSRPASTTSDDIRIDSSNRVRLIADKSGNSAVNCLCLNGVAGNYASFTELTAFGTGDFTVSVRMRVLTLAATQTVWGSGNNGFAFKINNTGKVVSSKTGVADNTVSVATVAVYQLVTMTYVRSGTSGIYYFDGVADNTISDSVNYTVGLSLLGQATASNPTTGNIHWARVYNAALTAPQVLADSNGTVQANCVLNIDWTSYAKLAASPVTAATGQSITINATGDLGARIAGERDLYQATASKQPVLLPFTGTKYGYVPAIAGTFSGQDIDVSGDLEVIVDFTPTVLNALGYPISKKVYTSVFVAYFTATNVQWYQSFNGAVEEFTSAIAHGMTAGVRSAFKFTRNATTGQVEIYKASSHNGSWTLLTSQTLTTGALFNNADVITIAARNNAGAGLYPGNYHYASVGTTIGGSPTQEFNPALYTGGTTFTASTGEVWTLNGGATIVDRTQIYFDGTDDYMKAPAFALSQPETVYFVGKQVTSTLAEYIYDGNSGPDMGLRQDGSGGVALNAGAVAATINFPVNTVGVLSSVFNAANSTNRLNRGSQAAGDAGTDSANGFTLGAIGTLGSFANITVSEILIFSAAHDKATQDRVIQYLGRKWGIAV